MKMHLTAAVLALSACAASPGARPAPPAPPTPAATAADQAGNRLETLGADRCSGDGRWCVIASGEAGAPVTLRHRGESAHRDYAVAPRERVIARPWPFIVRLAEASDYEPVLIGLLWETTDAYSGGGASETTLTLYQVGQGAATPVLEVLQSSDAMLRACFSEADARKRAQACHDEYIFAGVLALDPNNASGRPRFRYESRAATYPGRLSRATDSAERGALSAADLVWATDETCSVTRTFAWAGDAYAPEAPLPACEDYRTQ
jgi:hypothetical protein